MRYKYDIRYTGTAHLVDILIHNELMIFNLVKDMSTTENLSIFSTIEDLRNCSDDTLEAGIDSVSRDVVIAYILELRKKVKEAELGLWLVNFNCTLN